MDTSMTAQQHQQQQNKARLIGASLRKLRSLDQPTDGERHLRHHVLVSNFLAALRSSKSSSSISSLSSPPPLQHLRLRSSQSLNSLLPFADCTSPSVSRASSNLNIDTTIRINRQLTATAATTALKFTQQKSTNGNETLHQSSANANKTLRRSYSVALGLDSLTLTSETVNLQPSRLSRSTSLSNLSLTRCQPSALRPVSSRAYGHMTCPSLCKSNNSLPALYLPPVCKRLCRQYDSTANLNLDRDLKLNAKRKNSVDNRSKSACFTAGVISNSSDYDYYPTPVVDITLQDFDITKARIEGVDNNIGFPSAFTI